MLLEISPELMYLFCWGRGMWNVVFCIDAGHGGEFHNPSFVEGILMLAFHNPCFSNRNGKDLKSRGQTRCRPERSPNRNGAWLKPAHKYGLCFFFSPFPFKPTPTRAPLPHFLSS